MHDDGTPAAGRSLLDLDAPTALIARRVLLIVATALTLAFGLVLVWRAADALFVVFAGILFAVVLDAATDGLGKIVPLPRRLLLVLAMLVLLALLAGGAIWGGATVTQQAAQITDTLTRQYREWVGELQDQGIAPQTGGLMPSLGALAGNAARVVRLLAEGVTTFFVIVFLGAFFAWAPSWYKAPLLSLLPKDRRLRVNHVLDQTGHTLRWWLIGQFVSMATIFVVSLVALWAIGMPYAFLLALQAGLLAFIPTIGPALAGVVIVAVGFSAGATMALWGFGAYVLIQGVESNVTEPIVQRKTVALPPAYTLVAQVIAAALFGLLGAALAVPALAAASVIVRELYVRDGLGGGVSEDTVRAWDRWDAADAERKRAATTGRP